MIGFLLKKTFYDGWDNLLRLVFLNLGFLASVALPLFLSGAIPVALVSLLVLALGFVWCFVYLCAAALSLRAVSDHGSFGFADFWGNLKAGWKAGALMGAVSAMLFLLLWQVIPFYLAMESILGFLLAAVLFWTFLLTAVSLQFFLAIRARLDTQPRKIIRKCFVIFFDNPGFAVFCLLNCAATLALSLPFGLLIPGPAGALLFLDEALRLRLLKYDWLEANPEAEPSSRRRQIPWDEILIEEREKIGTRSLKNFIFPWKD